MASTGVDWRGPCTGRPARVGAVTELPVLTGEEQRILGSLMEKQTTVPASYPLTANALRTACNQSSNRDPVVDFDERTVEQTARALKERGLLRIVWADTGRRTLKYHQTLDERLDLAPDERALLTVLLLRGAQSPGELRTRTERMQPFADTAELQSVLGRLAERGFAELQPRRPGQKEQRYAHLLSSDLEEEERARPAPAPAATWTPPSQQAPARERPPCSWSGSCGRSWTTASTSTRSS